MRRNPYIILEHTGDAKIRVFGKTNEELFLNAMRGMCDLVRPRGEEEGKKIKRKIKIISQDKNALLVDFLSEINYLMQTKREIYHTLRVLKLSDRELEAELSGKKVEGFGEEIKAVTHYGLEIKRNARGFFQATVVFDI